MYLTKAISNASDLASNPLRATTKDGRYLYKHGLWNVLGRVGSKEGYSYLHDTAEWTSFLSNENAAVLGSLPMQQDDLPMTLEEGMDQVPKKMARQFLNASFNHNVRTNWRLTCINKRVYKPGYNLIFTKTITYGELTKDLWENHALTQEEVCAKRVVLAMPPATIRRLTWLPLEQWQLQDDMASVEPVPALRVLFAFDRKLDSRHRRNVHRVITDLPIRNAAYLGGGGPGRATVRRLRGGGREAARERGRRERRKGGGRGRERREEEWGEEQVERVQKQREESLEQRLEERQRREEEGRPEEGEGSRREEGEGRRWEEGERRRQNEGERWGNEGPRREKDEEERQEMRWREKESEGRPQGREYRRLHRDHRRGGRGEKRPRPRPEPPKALSRQAGEQHLYMVANVDGADTRYFADMLAVVRHDGACNRSDPIVQQVTRQLAAAFGLPEARVPTPRAVLGKDWARTSGECGWHIWKKGVLVDDVMNRMIKPIHRENVFVVGSAFCGGECQLWMEGGLKTVELMLQRYFNIR